MIARSPDRRTDGPDTRNALDGFVVGSVVQAGAVHGGVHIHHGDGPTQPKVPVSRQLPNRPPHWIDRDGELADLDRALGHLDARPALLLLTGLGGIGKTALALRWAHRVAAGFPDGHLYVDLGAASPGGPLPTADALGRLLRAMGVPPERVPVDGAEQAALWRSVTAGRRLLILLDNAATANQVRLLLPSTPGCVVVVIARTLLEGLLVDGARVTTVPPLDEQSAVTLLREAAGAGRSDTDLASTPALARLSAGMPLALTVIAAQLVSYPYQQVGGLVGDLTAEHQRLARLSIGDISVTSALDMSYQSLSGQAARGYRLLVGGHPATRFRTGVAAATLGMPGEEAAGVLDRLVQANLLTQVGPSEYHYHDLVGLHARQLALTDPERNHAHRRMLTWYLAASRVADEILTPYRHRTPVTDINLPPDPAGLCDNRDRALDWLEQERPNLVAVVRTFAVDLPYLVYLLGDSMWPLFHLGRHHGDRTIVDQIAVECARRLNNPAFEAAMLRRQGCAHYDTGHFDEAKDLFQQSLRLAEHLDGLGHVVLGAVAGLGVVALALAQDRPHDAAGYFARGLDLANTAGSARATALAMWHLGQAHRHAGQPADALRRLTEAAALFIDIGDTDRYNGALVHIELGRELAEAGQPEHAAAEINQALAEMTELRSPRGRAQALHALGELAVAGGRLADAAHHLVQAHRIYHALGDAEAAEVRRLIESGRLDRGGSEERAGPGPAAGGGQPWQRSP